MITNGGTHFIAKQPINTSKQPINTPFDVIINGGSLFIAGRRGWYKTHNHDQLERVGPTLTAH